MNELEKPFWLRPPHMILFDLLHLHRLKPWDVNVTFLLNSFLGEMKERGYIDFSLSGTALLSSSIIHRMKSELVLKMEEPPKLPVQRPDEEVPPPLPFPLRFEYTATSVEEMIRALEEVLKVEMSIKAKQRSPLAIPAIAEQLDEFLSNIEEHLKEFYESLVRLCRASGTVSFLKLVKGKSLTDAVRKFIMLLFLARDGKVRLYQAEEKGDITVSLVGATAIAN